ncbi:MAG: hydrogenase/urease nickel incorporation protein HypA [Epsilonproteobacteria bacterium]|nr:hydrogenase/urease nickel incorporation protein HypA [Campylobacterota bacterium]
MHEYSIVQSLIELCEKNAEKYHAVRIDKVIIKIGVLGGVEPYLVKTAFNAFKEKTICNDAELIINMQPLIIECNECDSISESKEPYCKCQKCGSTNAEIIDGKDMYLMKLEME